MKLSELQVKAPFIIIYGPPGCGKTALTLTLGESLHLMDLDNGLLTGLTLKDQFQSERLKVDVKQFIEKEPNIKVIEFQKAKLHIFDIAKQVAQKTWPFKVLAIDSFTALVQSAVAQVMSNSGRVGQNPEIQHWGLAFTEVINVFSVLKTLGVPVILLAHDQEGKEEGKIEIAIAGKKLAPKLVPFFDEILYMRAKQVGGGKIQYVLQTMNDGRVECRTRGQLPNMIDTSIGMWEVFKKMGYMPSERTVTK